MNKAINGFSKLSKQQKINWLVENFTEDPAAAALAFKSWQHADQQVQRVLDGFTENVVANYALPYCIAPNFLVNGQTYALPMVIEESSVVAAASSAAKFWADRGGFHAEVLDTVKLGQVHFRWAGQSDRLRAWFPAMKAKFIADAASITANMEQRGGGVRSIELLDYTDLEPQYYQIRVAFDTCDSMGANFVNSVLECFARSLENFLMNQPDLSDLERDVEVIMAILSNYTPDCRVRAWVECSIDSFADLARNLGMEPHTLADRFATAVRIATIDPYRATTHNKGIYNGIDAVVLATGNDFRAVEACGHTYASRYGQYRSLSRCQVKDGQFHFELEVPMAIGTVGGLTALHPLAKYSLELLGHPTASELMCIIACAGLAQNFAAVRSLVTTGIQHGHMKMHLTNMLHHLGASEEEAAAAQFHFSKQTVSFSAVRTFLDTMRVANV